MTKSLFTQLGFVAVTLTVGFVAGATSAPIRTCEGVFTHSESVKASDPALLLKQHKNLYRTFAATPFTFAKEFRARRSQWRVAHPEAPNDCPFPELVPLVRFYQATLIDRMKTHGQKLGPVSERVLGLLEAELDSLVRNNAPYERVQVATAEFATAMMILANNKNVSRSSAEEIAKIIDAPLKDRKTWWLYSSFISNKEPGQSDFSRVDDFVLPVPFPIGSQNLQRLWAARIFPVAALVPEPEWAYQGTRSHDDPETFLGHDYGHWSSTTLEYYLNFADAETREKLFLAFDHAISNVSDAELSKLGLVSSDHAAFIKIITYLPYVSDHEDGLPFGNAIRLHRNGIMFEEAFPHPEKDLGPRWETVLDAGLEWYNTYWQKHRLPSEDFPTFDD